MCLVYGKFIEVWRQKEAALQKSQLTKLLLANSAHEVRTPLNAIINYLEIALEGSLDPEIRDNLSKSHSASKSLIYVINDLLDLTKTEQGNDLIKDDVFDLTATVKEATDAFASDAKRKQLSYDFVANPGIPQYVVGDQRRVRQAVSNITANAIQNTQSGSVRIELWLARAEERHVDVDFAVEDTGAGMSPSKLDELFRELEQVQTEDVAVVPGSPTEDSTDLAPSKSTKRILGLGLAIVSRIVRNMNGQLRLKSEEGKGSRFVIQFSFALPTSDSQPKATQDPHSPDVSSVNLLPTTPPITEGEVTLVSKSAQKASEKAPAEVVRRNSHESMDRLKGVESFKSGSSGKSDVDRLIDAVQVPNPVRGMPSHDEAAVSSKRSSLRGASPSVPPSQPTFYGSGTSQVLQSPGLEPLGQVSVTDSKTPIKSVRVPELQSSESNADPSPSRSANRMSFDMSHQPKMEHAQGSKKLLVLVAEDDPVNSKIMSKRLEKLGHEVRLTVNGEQCASTYGDDPASFDVILMDMQVCFESGS